MTKEEFDSEFHAWEKEEIRDFKGREIYCNIVSVSRSGMSRKMRFYYVNSKREIVNITRHIARVIDYKLDKDRNLVIHGCGMDMVFHTLTQFNYAMARIVTGKTIAELHETKKYANSNIYDDFYINANRYGTL